MKRLFPPRTGGGSARICSTCVENCAQIMADGPTRIPGAAHVCAFCGRSENDVAVMLGVGEAMICDVCVDEYRAADQG